MFRTKLSDRKLPTYSKGEEVFNMVSHIVGGALGIAVVPLCVCMAVAHKNVFGIISGSIYGFTLILLYTIIQRESIFFQIIIHFHSFEEDIIIFSHKFSPTTTCPSITI